MYNLIFRLSFFLLILISIGCNRKEAPKALPSSNAHQILSEIDIKAKAKLSFFFELLVKDYDFAYTLFGNKPCSLATYPDPLEQSSLPTLQLMEITVLEEGWEYWVQYRDLFPSSHFILCKINFDQSTTKGFVLINKNATLDILKKNLEIFQKQLEIKLSAEDILETISQIDNHDLLEKIFVNGELQGIMLGYGSKNATGFQRLKDVSLNISDEYFLYPEEHLNGLTVLSLCFVEGYGRGMLKPTKGSQYPNQGFKTLHEELNHMGQTRETFELPGSDFLLQEIESPIFVIYNNDNETKQLLELYSRNRTEIIRAYKNKLKVEVTLDQWMKK